MRTRGGVGDAETGHASNRGARTAGYAAAGFFGFGGFFGCHWKTLADEGEQEEVERNILR